jgi:hypothetical protein
MSTRTTSWFFDTAKKGSERLKVTSKNWDSRGSRGDMAAVVQPDGMMSSVLLQHLGQKQCDKLVEKAKIAGITDISSSQILYSKSITTHSGLRLRANDSDGRPQLMYFVVQRLKEGYATANKLLGSSVYFSPRSLIPKTAQIQHELRAFIISELEDHRLPSVMALVKGHHVHVDYMGECLQALTKCIQTFQRVRTIRSVAKAPRVTCIDTDTSPVKLAAMVKDGEDFAALVALNDRQNAANRRANRLRFMEMAKILGVPFQPQVSESGQSVCQSVFIV